MAIECYYSDVSRVSRVFPIFFGRRADVFGEIGNLFREEEFLCLPNVVPVASLQLAARLLREGGIEPRPEFFSLTIKSIIHQMKKFLCIFAWTICPCENVTIESVNVILHVLKQCLANSSKPMKNGTAPASAPAPNPSSSTHDQASASLSKGTAGSNMPLKRCVEILQEGLGVESNIAATALTEALESLADDEVTQTCNTMKSLLAKMRYLACDVLGYSE